uniref:superoxide dismutase n=1 Tax=Schizochytrium sp. FJU-512 TaxID=297167 RepID=C8CGT9_9STRA|nr:putative superoxide dismutase [Schizochytrium sp. FJU-512]|eukprot:CAMPEP_0171491348 /NCGR_PEP_ID=MMETSP0958-20121227/3812_1 /TAXON_ID=87120 /ORGANISM="Aurantiochytrium limacinum, Strain ATCCMYA-1381" /LENGTH=151 /DNA_ID=CAMNT_0012024761 /DNA_START=56 /DNA_END=511 /DNA_ORIENTATION=-
MSSDKACVTLIGADGPMGTVVFTPEGDSVKVTGEVSGLTPGKHGFHIHQFGDVSSGCASTGGHYNPAGKTHGAPTDDERHAGDLGNIEANGEGVAKIDIVDAGFKIPEIIGRAVVVHEGEDDLGAGGHELSKTTGNAGGRKCCGIIGLQSA